MHGNENIKSGIFQRIFIFLTIKLKPHYSLTMESKVYIIETTNDYEYVSKLKCNNVIYIFTDYILFCRFYSKSNIFFYDFLESNFDNEYIDSLDHMSLEWYRDKDGKDLMYNGGFSLAPVITKKVETHLWDDYRNYLSLKSCVKEFSYINLPKCINLSIKKVSQYFIDNISFYDNGFNIKK